MVLTDIRIQVLKKPIGKLLAFATVTFDNSLVVQDFQIFDSFRGPFVSMPGRKLNDGTWKELVFPVDTDLKESINSYILRAYSDEINRPEFQSIKQ